MTGLLAEFAELRKLLLDALGLTDHEASLHKLVRKAIQELDCLRAQRDKLQAFKTWVHAYLDTHGVPQHPPGVHGAEGCRIGNRLDWLMAEMTCLRFETDYVREALLAANPLTFGADGMIDHNVPLPEVARQAAKKIYQLRQLHSEMVTEADTMRMERDCISESLQEREAHTARVIEHNLRLTSELEDLRAMRGG